MFKSDSELLLDGLKPSGDVELVGNFLNLEVNNKSLRTACF